jgi:hypothetical protein
MGEAIGTTLLFENDTCRVWLLVLEPGQASDWHTHQLPYVYVATRSGSAATEFADGTVEPGDDYPGFARYMAPDAGHRLVNTGPGRYENVIIELKETASD